MSIAMNQQPQLWEDGSSQNVTFIVTEDCQLRCKYCYIVGKNSKKKMTFETAAKTMDYILGNREWFSQSSVMWDFIGGEPLLEIDLIDRILDYFKLQAYKLGHPWFERYMINISTNGLMYDDPRVQRFIAKNRRHLNIGISIDGTRQKHDLQRVFPNGRGSYDDIVKVIPKWIRQFPDSSTKVTVAHEDLPFICESVLHLWSLGIREVNINVVFENVWQAGDDDLFEEQLRALADAIVEKRLFYTHKCSFFSTDIGGPVAPEDLDSPWCGAGRMLAVGTDGEFYPCVRFAPFSLTDRVAVTIGNCRDGVDTDRCRPFYTNSRRLYSPAECLECQVAGGCADCQGSSYDGADTPTVFQRGTAICSMHKARVRANAYFQARLQECLGGVENDEETG